MTTTEVAGTVHTVSPPGSSPWCDACDERPASEEGILCGPCRAVAGRPGYVYVASSWRNPLQPGVIACLRSAGIDCYDFRNPPNGSGFGWQQVGGRPAADGRFGEDVSTYLKMIEHPVALAGYEADFEAMNRADAFVLVLPCGRSAHLELGWAVGMGKRTAILLEDPLEPELMYRMVDLLTPSMLELLGWLGVED